MSLSRWLHERVPSWLDALEDLEHEVEERLLEKCYLLELELLAFRQKVQKWVIPAESAKAKCKHEPLPVHAIESKVVDERYVYTTTNRCTPFMTLNYIPPLVAADTIPCHPTAPRWNLFGCVKCGEVYIEREN